MSMLYEKVELACARNSASMQPCSTQIRIPLSHANLLALLLLLTRCISTPTVSRSLLWCRHGGNPDDPGAATLRWHGSLCPECCASAERQLCQAYEWQNGMSIRSLGSYRHACPSAFIFADNSMLTRRCAAQGMGGEEERKIQPTVSS